MFDLLVEWWVVDMLMLRNRSTETGYIGQKVQQ